MKFTSYRDLAVAVLLGGLLAHLGLRVAYASLPPLPVAAGVTLGVLAVVELLLAVLLRPRLQRRPGVAPVQPQTAVRVMALAKASSLLAALMLGAWLGALIYVAPAADTVGAAGDDSVAAIIGAACAAALGGAALWLEHCCRNPDDRNPDEYDPDDLGPDDRGPDTPDVPDPAGPGDPRRHGRR